MRLGVCSWQGKLQPVLPGASKKSSAAAVV